MSADPLPSWNDGAAKSAILDFVARIATQGSPDFVAPAERIAAFDDEGTLWCEQPFQVQFHFARDRLDALARSDPELKRNALFRGCLEQDRDVIAMFGKKGLRELAGFARAGMAEDEVAACARDWVANGRHLNLGRPLNTLTYVPQVELVGYLRAKGFKIFIVSDGDVDLVRAIAGELYGIPPEQVIGSSARTRLEFRECRGEVVRQQERDSFDGGGAKPATIHQHIGRRPTLAFGNSDGDLDMLRQCTSGPGARLGLILHHDDAGREFAYDRDFRLDPLARALDQADEYGITLVSMMDDWNTVFDDA
ncbi:HAD family hydrolase [Mesorhizobium marinum]|uniref:HAD family hydrolase n=1 Tax=Mesorhizobium marinum TaxID=3228790 RepID=UPI003467A856